MKLLHLLQRRPCNIVIPILIVLLNTGCGTENPDEKIPTVNQEVTNGGIYAEVIIPAGFSGGVDDSFLPYPGNWAVLRSPDKRGLHTIILSDAYSRGSVLEITPVAVLQLDSAGTQVNIVVSVPTDTAMSTLQLTGFVDLLTDHEPVRHILQTWFVNHRGFGSFELVGWRDEEAAKKLLSQ